MRPAYSASGKQACSQYVQRSPPFETLVKQPRDDGPNALAVQPRDRDEAIMSHLHVPNCRFEKFDLEAAEDCRGCKVEFGVGQALRPRSAMVL